MFKFILSAALVSITVSITAQNFVRTSFLFRNEGQPFSLNETITAYNGIDYNIQSMAFYMSRVKITHDGGQITALDTNEVYYVNFNVPEIILGSFPISQVEAITFEVGVPEYMNHLDISLYPEHHALSFHDPSMHWGWASGYMHMVMNGKGDDNGDGTPTTAYELNCLRSEEHTSELQSQFHLVCRLLLEKTAIMGIDSKVTQYRKERKQPLSTKVDD